MPATSGIQVSKSLNLPNYDLTLEDVEVMPKLVGLGRLQGRTTGSLLNLPSWIAELSVPFCFLLLLIQSFLEIIKLLKNIEPPESDH